MVQQLHSHSDKMPPFQSAQAFAFQHRRLASAAPCRLRTEIARQHHGLLDVPTVCCPLCQVSSTAVRTITLTATDIY